MSGRLSVDQIDRQLGDWLREESLTRAPAGLIEDVFARTSRTGQVRRWWPPVGVGRGPRRGPQLVGAERRTRRWWGPGTALAGAAAVVLVAVIVALSLRPATGPGASPTPRGSNPASEGPSPTSVVRPSPARSIPASPSPVPTTLGTAAARRLSLGLDAGPIAVFEAFDSIWVANIHANDVRRYDPTTMAQLARIPVPSAAWFAVADGALWVTSQTGSGLSRIDPATNTVVAHVGDATPCGAPVVAFGSLWQAACDSNVFLRIDPARNAVVDTIPAQGHIFLVLAGGQLITAGPGGLARLDPDTGAFTAMPNPAAVGPEILQSDGATVWVKNSAGFAQIDPADGRTLVGLSYPDARAITFAGDHAWLSVANVGVLEIGRSTMNVRRTIPVLSFPLVALEAGGALWVTDFDSSLLWKVDL